MRFMMIVCNSCFFAFSALRAFLPAFLTSLCFTKCHTPHLLKGNKPAGLTSRPVSLVSLTPSDVTLLFPNTSPYVAQSRSESPGDVRTRAPSPPPTFAVCVGR